MFIAAFRRNNNNNNNNNNKIPRSSLDLNDVLALLRSYAKWIGGYRRFGAVYRSRAQQYCLALEDRIQ